MPESIVSRLGALGATLPPNPSAGDVTDAIRALESRPAGERPWGPWDLLPGIAGTANFVTVASNTRGVWVALSASGTNRLRYSTNDGRTWAEVPALSESLSWVKVVWLEEANIFVAVASTGAGAQSRAMHSPDGINWTFEGLPSNGIGAHAWRDAVVHGGEIIIIAAGGQVVTTADGRNFVAVLPGVEGAAGLQKILSDGRGALMVVGNAGPVRCAVSSDGGRTWGVRTALNPDKAWIGLGYFAKKGTWIASNTNIVTGERFAVSADLGLTWRWIPIPSSLTGRYFIDLGDSLWWGSDGGVNLAGAPISAGESLDGVDYSFFTNTRVSGMQGMAWDGRNTAIAMMTGGHIIRRERI